MGIFRRDTNLSETTGPPAPPLNLFKAVMLEAIRAVSKSKAWLPRRDYARLVALLKLINEVTDDDHPATHYSDALIRVLERMIPDTLNTYRAAAEKATPKTIDDLTEGLSKSLDLIERQCLSALEQHGESERRAFEVQAAWLRSQHDLSGLD